MDRWMDGWMNKNMTTDIEMVLEYDLIVGFYFVFRNFHPDYTFLYFLFPFTQIYFNPVI